MPGAPCLTILMATRNGAAYLPEQIDSISALTYRNWRLLVSDDGSTDATMSILSDFQRRLGAGKVTLIQGPERGATANFLFLLQQTTIADGYIAFCDQDDIWIPEKLTRAIDQIKDHSATSARHGCRALIVDQGGKNQRITPLPVRALGFRHALAENILTGNAMVLNPAGANLLRHALMGHKNRDALEAGFHDWWAYQVISASGGRIFYDPQPNLHYRQHSANLVGSGQAKGQMVARIARALGGTYAESLRLQARNLAETPGLDPAAQEAALRLLALRDCWFWQRPRQIRKIGLYRQNRVEDLLLKFLLVSGQI